MLFTHTTPDAVIAAAAAVGCRAKIGTITTTKSGPRFRARIFPATRMDDPQPGEAKWEYQRHSCDLNRLVYALCWHGFKAFFDEFFLTNPDAHVQTSVTRYRGFDEYLAKFEITGMQNIGTAYAPMQYREACDCYGGA